MNGQTQAAVLAYAVLSIACLPVALGLGYWVAQIPGCSPWVGCLLHGVMLCLVVLFLGLVLGVVSWRKAESPKMLAWVAILLNLMPFFAVLWFLAK